jgi:hypothetical protein
MSTVNILVTSDGTTPSPIAGAVVSIVDPATNLALVARATTNSSGIAGFDIPDGVYELRLYKRNVVFGGPVAITVLGNGAYTVTGTLMLLPVATDPLLCRCTGRFVGFSGQPLANVTLVFTQRGDTENIVPRVFDSQLVGQSDLIAHTNTEGFITLDLIRTGEFKLSISGEELVWDFRVPDRSSANLIDLLHPQPVSLTWDPTLAPANAITVQVGQTITVPVSLVLSNYEVLNNGATELWLAYLNSDSIIAPAAIGDAGMEVTGGAVGTAQISASARQGFYPRRVPDPPVLVTTPLTINVTP